MVILYSVYIDRKIIAPLLTVKEAASTPVSSMERLDEFVIDVPYDPLKKGDPDTTLSAEEHEIGGLGVYMVKKSMDAVAYEYKDGQNVLKIAKKL